MTLPVERLKRRKEFLRVASAKTSAATPGLVLQARRQKSDEPTIRVGFTASRKVGKAVVRNRARRRLKSVVKQVLEPLAQPGYDYVVIARAASAERDYSKLLSDMKSALKRLKLLRISKQPDQDAVGS